METILGINSFPEPREFLTTVYGAEDTAIAAGEERFAVGRKAEPRGIAFGAIEGVFRAAVVRSERAFGERVPGDFLPAQGSCVAIRLDRKRAYVFASDLSGAVDKPPAPA